MEAAERTTATAEVTAAPATPDVHFRDETGFRWMYVTDALGLYTIMVLITAVRFGTDEWPGYSQAEYLGGFAIATLVHMVVSYFGGLYDREHRLGNPSRLARVSGITALAVLNGEQWPELAQEAGLDPAARDSVQNERVHAMVLKRFRNTSLLKLSLLLIIHGFKEEHLLLLKNFR